MNSALRGWHCGPDFNDFAAIRWGLTDDPKHQEGLTTRVTGNTAALTVESRVGGSEAVVDQVKINFSGGRNGLPNLVGTTEPERPLTLAESVALTLDLRAMVKLSPQGDRPRL